MSVSQQSTRYCRYNDGKDDGELTFIKPFYWDVTTLEFQLWHSAMKECEDTYLTLLEHGVTPELARSVLPNSLKTEIVVTANMREWRHIFSLRCGSAAHPQMREVMRPLLREFYDRCPALFFDVYYSITG